MSRSRAALIREAAGDLPGAITARWSGQCHICLRWWNPGDRIVKAGTAVRWAHAHCAVVNDAASRLAARRARLKAQRESATH